MTNLTHRNTVRRVNGAPVVCFEKRDGVQRREWVGVNEDGDAAFGTIYKDKWQGKVDARRPNGETRTFAVFQYGMTTEQAFTAARLWLVGAGNN